MAAATRGGLEAIDGVIFQSDRGSEYTAAATNTLCRGLGVVRSMGRVASVLDNSPAESFNSTLKVEFVHRHRHRIRTRAEVALRIVTWITSFYNPTRPQPVWRDVADQLRDPHGRPPGGGRRSPVTRRGRIKETFTVPGD